MAAAAAESRIPSGGQPSDAVDRRNHAGSQRTAGGSGSLQPRMVYEPTSTGHASLNSGRDCPGRFLGAIFPTGADLLTRCQNLQCNALLQGCC